MNVQGLTSDLSGFSYWSVQSGAPAGIGCSSDVELKGAGPRSTGKFLNGKKCLKPERSLRDFDRLVSRSLADLRSDGTIS